MARIGAWSRRGGNPTIRWCFRHVTHSGHVWIAAVLAVGPSWWRRYPTVTSSAFARGGKSNPAFRIRLQRRQHAAIGDRISSEAAHENEPKTRCA